MVLKPFSSHNHLRLLKITEDPKKLLFVWDIAADVCNIEVKSKKIFTYFFK